MALSLQAFSPCDLLNYVVKKIRLTDNDWLIIFIKLEKYTLNLKENLEIIE